MWLRIFRGLGNGIFLTARITTMTFGLIIYYGLALLGIVAVIAVIYALT